MVFNNLSELLARGYVELGDEINIKIFGVSFRLTVKQSWLNSGGRDNSGPLKLLGYSPLEKYKALSDVYGYPATSGDWPDCKEGDYKALYRAARWLYERAGYSHFPPPMTSSHSTWTAEKGDSVAFRSSLGIKGMIMSATAVAATVAWEHGNITTVQISDLILINKTTKTQEHEHLQKQDLPVKGGKGSSGIGISDRGSGPTVGCRHHGYEASLEDSEPCIRSSKIRGTAAKF